MQFQKIQGNLLAIIIFACVLAKIVSLLLLPQEAYNDALFHIFTTNQIISGQTFDLAAIGVPPPFYYSSFGTIFLLSGIVISVFSAKIFGIVAIFLQLALAVIVFKKIFQKNFLPALAFFTAFPWITRFTSTAYPESITIVFVLAAIFLMLKISKKNHVGLFEIFPLSIIIGAMSLSKLNGTILVPAFILSAIFLLQKKAPGKTTGTFVLLALFFSSFWFGSNFIKFGQFDRHIGQDAYNFGGQTGFSLQSIVQNLHYYYLYFWDFPNAGTFSFESVLYGLDFFQIATIFFIITIPLFAILFLGAKKAVGEKNYLTILLILPVILIFIPVVQRIAYFRLIIPAVPGFAILFGFGFEQLKEKFQTIAVLALLFFAIFSVAYTTVSAYHYHIETQKNQSLYERIIGLPSDSVVLIEANRARDIEFVLGKKVIGVSSEFTPEFLQKNPQDFIAALKEKNVSHIAVVCKKDPFGYIFLQELLEQGFLDKIFEQGCSKLFEVNYK